MTKWADYGISAVKFRDDNVYILSVKVHEDKGESIGNAFEVRREDIVSSIKSGKTFCTILRKDNKWSKGEDVGIVAINNKEFIRTDKNQTERDNLSELPEF
ncbi:MAG: DUF3892 domain-containing protein [Ignavibacteriae bacterium]|nr:DUF3892 domain-containing protein [Ignavibacteriota bacterium]